MTGHGTTPETAPSSGPSGGLDEREVAVRGAIVRYLVAHRHDGVHSDLAQIIHDAVRVAGGDDEAFSTAVPALVRADGAPGSAASAAVGSNPARGGRSSPSP
ncbi:hypothetical protein ACIQUL_29510 [Streptomyces sp. NPDC090303]|uniref:hypothetical protein n=1 Tax=Streptomyces sp. NPDC090303 TaxID=3365960 RepID=UPI0038054C33